MHTMIRWQAAIAWLALALTITVAPGVSGAEETMAPEVFRRVADVLAGRQVATEAAWASRIPERALPSLQLLFRQTVRAVPVIVSRVGDGSGVVIHVDQAESRGLVITNHHVVMQPFRSDHGVPVVSLVFYEPELAQEPLEREKLATCLRTHESGAWCEALRRSHRVGVVVGVDPDRDLALLEVPNLPRTVYPIAQANITEVEPGIEVAVIGHPLGFLWSLTTGHVNGVRLRYPMGKSLGTVIQTQTLVAPGSSGAPLLELGKGGLIGVISWGVPEAPGLNAAIAINEVQAFASEQAPRVSQRGVPQVR